MNKASRKLNAMLLGYLICTLCNTASAAIMLTVQPASSTLSVGDTTDVSIVISGLGANVAPSLGTFDIDLIFSPSVLGYVGAQFGGVTPKGDQLDLSGLGSLSGSSVKASGDVNFYEVSLDEAVTLNTQQADSYTLVTLNFRALALGSSRIGIVINSLGDADGVALTAETQGTAITVTAIPLPESVWLFGAALLTLLGINKRRQQHRLISL